MALKLVHDGRHIELVTVDEFLKRVKPISKERVDELIVSERMPHYRVLDIVLLEYNEAKAWLEKNCVRHYEGKPLPLVINVGTDVRELSISSIPPALRCMSPILKHYHPPRVPAAVYFLVDEYGEVVYVGQTISLGGRIADHQKGEKAFSTVYYIEVPESLLNIVENRLIAFFKPKFNQKGGGERSFPVPFVDKFLLDDRGYPKNLSEEE